MASSSPHQILLQALQKRLAIVADRDFYQRDPAGHLQALKDASADLEEVYRREHAAFEPQLRHFVERQSYQKAVEYLSDSPSQ